MKLPQIPNAIRNRVHFDLSETAIARWNPAIHAAEKEAGDIGIFDFIGADYFGEGVTAKRIAAALRSIGKDKPVTVNINSPGGDLFEGLAIYNILREHQGDVTVKVLGMAASAASVIAMAGDRIEIARAGFLMVHNTWVLAIGNRNDLREFADFLEPFDRAMADVYSARTGDTVESISLLMDAETWIPGSEAVKDGWADALLPADEVKEDKQARAQRIAAHEIDKAMAKAGYSRSERRRLLGEFKTSMQTAAGTGTPGAAGDTPRAVDLTETVALATGINPFEDR